MIVAEFAPPPEWADTWAGRALDAAAAQASIDSGECDTTLTTARTGNPHRLAEFAAAQKRDNA